MTTDFSGVVAQATLAALGEGILITDREGRFTYANPAAERALGWAPGALLGKCFCRDVCNSCQASGDWCLKRTVEQAETRSHHDGSFRACDGSPRSVAFIARPVIADGTVDAVAISFHDITERKHAQETLDRFKSTLDRTLDCVFMFDARTLRFIYVNQGAMAQVGYSENALLTMTPVDIKPEFDAARFQRIITPLIEGRQDSLTFETVHRHKDGRDIPVEVFLQYINGGSDAPRFVAIVRDVTEQRRDWRITRLFHEVDCGILQGQTPEQVLSLVCEQLTEEFQLDLAWVGLREPDGSVSIHSPSGNRTSCLNHIEVRWDETPAGDRPAGLAIRSGRTQHYLLDDKDDAAWKAAARANDFKALLAVPLRNNDSTVGALNLYSRRADAFDDSTVARLEEMAARLSVAISTAQDQQRLRLQDAALRSTANAVFITDANGVIQWVNHAFSSLSGYRPEEAIGHTPHLLKSGRQTADFYRRLWATLQQGEAWRGDIINRHKNGQLYTVEQTITPMKDEQGRVTHYVAIHEDVTERKQAEQRIRHMVNHDELTGLPNRILFRERLEQALAQSHRDEQLLAVLFLDLDHFKDINDTMGHPTGDRLLQKVAQRLRNAVRESDTVARLGGDEFAIIQTGLKQIDGASHLAEKLLHTLEQPFQINGRELHTSTSIGLTIYPLDDGDPDRLLKHADLAMYRAKQAGRGDFHYYDIEMDRQAQRKASLERDLRRALERNEFELHYQPQLDLASDRIVGVEALLRWRHPQLGYVSPADFIPIAESSRLILPIGDWVLAEACRQNRSWQAAGLPPLQMAVNLSAVQFRDQRLPERVAAVLAETGLAAEYLELELTESVLMHHNKSGIETLQRLNELGIELAIDDFGTGYSSLSYLQRFPMQKIKLDRSFVSNYPNAKDNAVIAKAVIQLGHSLNLRVVAEGVETEEQLEFLRTEGSNLVQGFHICRPLPADELARLVGRQPSRLIA